MVQALSNWINCNSVGQSLRDFIDEIPVVRTPELATTVGWCNSAVRGLASVLNFATAVGELKKAGADINISGVAYLKDTNADNIVDDITNGNWIGSMTIKTTDESGNSVAASTGVKGIWSAYNLDNVNSGGSMYCTYPKTATDSDDQICSYPPIDITALM